MTPGQPVQPSVTLTALSTPGQEHDGGDGKPDRKLDSRPQADPVIYGEPVDQGTTSRIWATSLYILANPRLISSGTLSSRR